MHHHVEANALICFIERLYETNLGGFSLHQLSLETLVTLLLESSLVTSIFL